MRDQLGQQEQGWEQELTHPSEFCEFLSPVSLRDAGLRCSPSAVLDYATDPMETQVATAVTGVLDVGKEVGQTESGNVD